MNPNHYLDAAAFTHLFQDRDGNRDRICAGLSKLAAGVARRFWFLSVHDRRDIEANALFHAIERIDRFTVGRGDAFAYYTSLIHRNILRQMDRARRRAAKAMLFTDLNANVRPGAAELEGEKMFRQSVDLLGEGGVPYSRAV